MTAKTNEEKTFHLHFYCTGNEEEAKRYAESRYDNCVVMGTWRDPAWTDSPQGLGECRWIAKIRNKPATNQEGKI